MKAESVKLPQARQDELFIEQLGDEMLVYDAKRFCAYRYNPRRPGCGVSNTSFNRCDCDQGV